MRYIITETQYKRLHEVKCDKCGHSWKIEKGDEFPHLCHGCGYDNKTKKYNPTELANFWKNYITESEKKDPFKLSKKQMENLIDLGKKHMDYSEEETKDEIESIINSLKKLPSEIKLFRIIRADDKSEINVKRPGSHYAKNKKDLMSSHSFADGVGDNSYILTILTPKELIDFIETIYNNLLYPHENEITLKNKGEGVKILSIKKMSGNKEITEKWSEKYKRSIDCNNAKGFSQRSHCQGKKKRLKESNGLSKNEQLVLSMFNKGLNFNQIKQITNFDDELIIPLLRDKLKVDSMDCQQLYNIFYDTLWDTKYISRGYKFDDGSHIMVDMDSMSGTLDVEFYDSDGLFYIKLYATFLYDGECVLPIDIIESGYVGGEYKDFELYDKIDLKKDFDFIHMETMSDLINYFNYDYFYHVKFIIDKYTNTLKAQI